MPSPPHPPPPALHPLTLSPPHLHPLTLSPPTPSFPHPSTHFILHKLHLLPPALFIPS